MPNLPTDTELIMDHLLKKCNDQQVTLFTELLEQSAQMGKDTETLIQDYREFNGLSEKEIKETFVIFVKVLQEHEAETIRNFENITRSNPWDYEK